MTPLLSVYHEYPERIGRNNSSHISPGNSSGPARTTTLFFVFSVLLLAGCASDRSSEKHQSDRPFFDSPDVNSLHYLGSRRSSARPHVVGVPQRRWITVGI